MKEQTFISFLIDKDGNQLDFERWSQKRLKAVKKKIQEYYLYYEKILPDAVSIIIKDNSGCTVSNIPVTSLNQEII